MATLFEFPAEPASLPPLAFALDLSCPLPLPARKPAADWAFPTAGAPVVDETLDTYLSRRYLETVYLGETLSPISGFLADLARAAAAHETLDAHIVPRLRWLADIEERHRKVLRPVLVAAMSGTMPEGVEERVLASAVEVRVRARAVGEGRGLTVRDIAEEFERREILLQLVLLLFWRVRNPPPELTEDEAAEAEKKKRRRKGPLVITEEPEVALELLADRIGVWMAVAELGLGIGADVLSIGTSAPKVDERSVSATLKRFWESCLVATFLPSQPKFLSTFHKKVFGTPIPDSLFSTKKPRKPKVTRRLSVDEYHATSNASGSGAVASANAVASSSTHRAAKMQRMSSRTSDEGMGRSRSVFSDDRDRERERERDLRSRAGSLEAGSLEAAARKPPVVRAPSGKDLFKGREVGLFRRTSSRAAPAPGADADSRAGLLGRKAAHAILRRHESQTAHETQSLARAETLIFATPAKPKHPGFGGRQVFHPTPIREEPSSSERPHRSGGSHRSYVADTPRVAETPVRRVLATPARMGPITYSDDDDEDEDYAQDDFEDLMVPTDSDSSDDEGPLLGAFVPETPRR